MFRLQNYGNIFIVVLQDFVKNLCNIAYQRSFREFPLCLVALWRCFSMYRRCLVALYFEKSGFFCIKKWFFLIKKPTFSRIICDKATRKLNKAMILSKKNYQILSKNFLSLDFDALYCEGVIPVTCLNWAERYAGEE